MNTDSLPRRASQLHTYIHTLLLPPQLPYVITKPDIVNVTVLKEK